MKKLAIIIGSLAGVIAAVVVAVGVIGWGPSLLAFQAEHALRKCENFNSAGASSAGIRWQGPPRRPGWVCETDSGTRYIGWFVVRYDSP